MDSTFQYDTFLSHSAKDKAVVRPLAERLQQDGLKMWFDKWVIKPGDSIPAKIEEGLKARKKIAQGKRSETSAALGHLRARFSSPERAEQVPVLVGKGRSK